MSGNKVEIEIKGSTLDINILEASLSGDNHILAELKEHSFSDSQIESVKINMKNVSYINSTGISEIISIYKRFKNSSIYAFTLDLNNVSPRVNAILELVEITNIANVHLQ